MDLVRSIEWEGESTRLVKLGGLPHSGKPIRVVHRRIDHVIIHQSAGNFTAGVEAPIKIAQFHTSPPKYKRDETGAIVYRKVHGKPRKWWIGGGRGWPTIAYTFVIPAVPDVVDGKFEVYRCNDDDVWSYHTGPSFNSHGVGVVVAGFYESRHVVNSMERPAPDLTAQIALRELVLDYLLPRYSLGPDGGLMGHFDAGKAACPGDFMEQWIRYLRGEGLPDPMAAGGSSMAIHPEETDDRKLVTARDRQQALSDLGYDVGPVDGIWGERSKGALLAFQDSEGLVADAIWDPQTEKAVRMALAAG